MLILGDCIEEMKNLDDNSIDMCLTDPPYGATACKWDTVIPFEPMWNELKRIVKDNGAICLFGSEPFSSALRMSNIKMFKYDWIWYKNKPSGMATAKYRPMCNHEVISVFCIIKTAYYPIKEERDLKPKYAHLKEKDFSRTFYGTNTQGFKGKTKSKFSALRNPTTVKRFDNVSNHAGRLHPTQKPVPLLEYLIKTYTLENETVLDFTMGSGSTGVACKNLNRKFIGIEKDKNYYEIAKKRISDA